ncbi:MAG: glucosamine-6-phosphate deaminase [Paracoccus sp. (in: a-proteobacteria)]|nr:glucosamine-6-phosphate deaminase [Paracoccus sp. (in: a-proteobacteria)]
MRVLILDAPDEATARAAGIIVAQSRAKPDRVPGLATGGEMLPLYDKPRAAHEHGRSFARATSFNLDDYAGLSPDEGRSSHASMRGYLFDHVDVAPENAYLPRADAPDAAAGSARADAVLSAAGGTDPQLLAPGQNGHLGFDDPTSSLTSRSRVKTLTQDTRVANARYFPNGDTPRFAIATGVGTIEDPRHCLVLATGRAKAAALMIGGAACPASIPHIHRQATVVLDRAATAELRLPEYDVHVHPNGEPRVLS